MTKEITKSIILQEIQDKFKLREFESGKFLFDETVVPIYDIKPHLQKWETLTSRLPVSSAPAAMLFYTVPENERWTVRGYNVVFLASGAYKVTGVYLWRGVSGVYLYLDMTLGQTVSYAKTLESPFVLNPGDRIYVYVDDYTSTADLDLNIDVAKEEIR